MSRMVVMSLLFALSGNLLAAQFCGLVESDGSWLVKDSSGGLHKLMGVDQVRWDGMPCERLGWRRPYEEHNRTTYRNRAAWENETLCRLKAWGFNMLGACSDDSLQHRGLSHAIFLNLSEAFCTGDKSRWCSEFKGVPNTAMPNVFHPDFAAHCDRTARDLCAGHREDRDLIGYFIDNELVWQATDDPAAAAETYFRVTTEVIRKYDPNHLILGCRFAGLDGAPEAVWKAAGRYCDVVTFNCYPWVDLDRNVVLDVKGGRSLAARFAEVYQLTDRPLLVTEWSFPALDTGRPCRNGAGQRFASQSERIAASELFIRTIMAIPYVLGHSYFMWLDQPSLGTNGENPEDCNYGLVSEVGMPYAGLVSMFARLNREVGANGRPLEMPKMREDPLALPETSEAVRFGASARGLGSVDFREADGAWRLSNGEGLELFGSRKGKEMVTAVRRNGIEYGRYTGMAQVMAEDGVSKWIKADSIDAVKYEASDGLGSVVVTATGAMDDFAVEMTHRLTLAAEGSDLLVEIVGLRNVGTREFSLRRLYACPIATTSSVRIQRGVPNLWRGKRECYWVMPDRRRYGIHSSDLSAEWFNLWLDEEGVPHPDISFIPKRNVRLKPFEAYCPDESMSAIVECTIDE